VPRAFAKEELTAETGRDKENKRFYLHFLPKEGAKCSTLRLNSHLYSLHLIQNNKTRLCYPLAQLEV